MIQTGIDSYPVQPGEKRGVRIKGVQVPVSLDERVLGGIFGVLRIAQHVNAQVINPILIFENEFSEYRPVAAFKFLDQIELVCFHSFI